MPSFINTLTRYLVFNSHLLSKEKMMPNFYLTMGEMDRVFSSQCRVLPHMNRKAKSKMVAEQENHASKETTIEKKLAKLANIQGEENLVHGRKLAELRIYRALLILLT